MEKETQHKRTVDVVTPRDDTFTRLDAYVKKVVPHARYEYVTVTFPSTPDIDMAVQHSLDPTDPESVLFQVVRIDKAGHVYQDMTGTKKAWLTNTIYLRCSVASATATLLLSLRPS